MSEPPLLANRDGAALLAQGRFDEAIASFRRHAALHPRQVEAWTALADCLFVSSRPDAALIAYNAALRLDPTSASALCGKAFVLQSRSEVAEARALFQVALHADPLCPQALVGLAKLAIADGEWADAEAWADMLLATAPGVETAWLSARIAFGRGDAVGAETRLRRLLVDFPLQPLQRADALLMLSETLDALGRYRDAFAAALDGKALQRRFYAERAAGRENEPAKLARLGAWFKTCDPAPWRERVASAPVEGVVEKHVFLLGFPRSGTTLLEQALAGHPKVQALEEAPTLAEAYAEFLTTPQGLERLSCLSENEARVWRSRFWSKVRRLGISVDAGVFIDKNPAGSLYMPLIAKLFPRALVLFALRDPRDVVLSCFRNNFQMNAMTYAFTDLADAAACYDACMRMVDVYRKVLPLNLMDVRHEYLVRDFDGALSEICRFIGIEVTPDMADIAATTRRRVVRTPSAPQLREGLNEKGVRRWLHYRAEIAPIRPVLDRWAARFDYAPED